MANSKINDMGVVAGNNTLVLIGDFEPDNSALASDMVSRYLKGKNCTVTAKTTYGKESTIPLIANILRNVTFTTDMPGNKTDLIQSVDIRSMNLVPIDNTTVAIDTLLAVNIFNPLGSFNLNITDASAFLYFETLSILHIHISQ